MKIDPSQTPQPNAAAQETDACQAPGTPQAQGQNVSTQATPGQGKPAAKSPDAPLKSPFFNLLSKGKRGEADATEGADVEGGLAGMPRGSQHGSRGGPALPGAHLHGPLSAATSRTPEAAKPADMRPARYNERTSEPRRSELPGGEQKSGTPTIAGAGDAGAGRNLTDQPEVSQVHAAGSTADVERIQALTQEMVDKLETTKGPGGDDRVDIQFNSRTLEGLQVSISRNDAGVSIRFQTASEPVSQLLSQNMQTLVQALAVKGVEVGDVRVANSSAASEAGYSGTNSRESRQGGRGTGSGGGGGSSGGSSGGQGGQRGGR